MNAWDVWYANFPYEEDPTIVKERPVIVLNVEPLEVLSIKVTHHDVREYDKYDVPIEKWREAGLIKPSVARISKAIYLNNNAFTNMIGQLHPDDIVNIYDKYIESKSEQEAATTKQE